MPSRHFCFLTHPALQVTYYGIHRGAVEVVLCPRGVIVSFERGNYFYDCSPSLSGGTKTRLQAVIQPRHDSRDEQVIDQDRRRIG